MEIIANHAHLMPPDSWREGTREMLLEWMDALGISRAVVFPPFACQMCGDMKAANRWAWGQVRPHRDRLIPFATINPTAPDALEVLDMACDEGAKGIKIHPSVERIDLVDPRAMDFYGEAAARGVVLDFHTGVHGSELSHIDPMKFDTILWRFPNVRMVFEHVGGRAFYEIILAILYQHNKDDFLLHDDQQYAGKRAYAGITSILSPDNLWYLGAEKVEELARLVGADVLIYGIDFPWHPVEDLRREIEMLSDLPLSEQDKAKLFGGSLSTLLGLTN